MTELAYRSIDYILENLEAREKRMCARYIEHNPGDAERRKHDADIYITALHTVRSHISELYRRSAAQ